MNCYPRSSTGRSFNVIYIPFGQKVDIFPANDEFCRAELERATRLALPLTEQTAGYPVASAEDILLAKLNWYKAGGETSDRQWGDIVRVIAASPAMDWEYVDRWAPRLGIERLVARARRAGE